jgi:hypothetical protein
MTSKRGVVKKKKTVVKKLVLREELRLPLEPVPLLREALICAIDDPKRWGQPGTAAEAYRNDARAMNVIAEKAADLCRGDRCFFCGVKQDPTPPADVYRFNPTVPLCACHAPFRKMAFDYIENWDSPEGKKYILAQVDAGKIALDTPVYQYFCQCKRKEPVIVDVRAIVYGLRKNQKHARRRLCNTCYLASAVRRKSQNESLAMSKRPKSGPSARINKIRQTKNAGPVPQSLPPLDAVLTETQLAELDKKALEKLNAPS